MENTGRHDAWDAGQNYETYMGRWSNLVANQSFSIGSMLPATPIGSIWVPEQAR